MLFVAAHILTYSRKICHSHTTKVLNHVKTYIYIYISISVQPTLKKGDFLHAKYITLEVDDFENEIKTIW